MPSESEGFLAEARERLLRTALRIDGTSSLQEEANDIEVPTARREMERSQPADVEVTGPLFLDSHGVHQLAGNVTAGFDRLLEGVRRRLPRPAPFIHRMSRFEEKARDIEVPTVGSEMEGSQSADIEVDGSTFLGDGDDRRFERSQVMEEATATCLGGDRPSGFERLSALVTIAIPGGAMECPPVLRSWPAEHDEGVSVPAAL